jgi:hypothetical protein
MAGLHLMRPWLRERASPQAWPPNASKRFHAPQFKALKYETKLNQPYFQERLSPVRLYAPPPGPEAARVPLAKNG